MRNWYYSCYTILFVKLLVGHCQTEFCSMSTLEFIKFIERNKEDVNLMSTGILRQNLPGLVQISHLDDPSLHIC